MRFSIPRLLSGALALSVVAPLSCQAQDDAWNIGIAVAARSPLYAGETSRLRPFPYIYHEGERFYVKGPSLGWKFVATDTFSLSGFVAARFDGVDRDEFGRTALAEHGIDRDLLDNRGTGVDAGVSATVTSTAAGEFELELRSDISGHSKGQDASLDYRYPLHAGRVTVIPGVGVTALSRRTADYYYGVLPAEAARGVPDYRPGSAVVPHARLAVIAPFGERWTGIVGVNIDVLPNELADSPLLEDDTRTVPAMFIAVARRF